MPDTKPAGNPPKDDATKRGPGRPPKGTTKTGKLLGNPKVIKTVKK